MELSLEELAKSRPVKTPREEAKLKADKEVKNITDNQANLFKLSLNKEKWYYKEMDDVDVIAEANSTDERSTVKNSLTGNKLDSFEAIADDKKQKSSLKNKSLKSQNINIPSVSFKLRDSK